MSETVRKGLRYESIAKQFLIGEGLVFLQAGFNCRLGEIDLIMQDQDTCCFIEVKYRQSRRFGGAAYALTPTKQRRVINATRYYLSLHTKMNQMPLRFDAILIQGEVDRKDQINWVKNAFYAE